MMDQDPERTPPAPPPPGLQRPAQEIPLVEYFRRRLESAELELTAERERARDALSHIRRQEELRGEVDSQLKAVLEQLRAEKAAKESDEEKARAHGRIDALEKRLDDMHGQWASLVKEALGGREAGADAAAEGLASLRGEIASLRETLAAVPKRLAPEVGLVTERLEAGSRRLDEEGQRFLEEMRQALQKLSAGINDRLSEMDRRLSLELEKHQDRLGQLVRERTALQEAFEEDRHQVRQETAKQTLALQARWQDDIAKLAEALERVHERQKADAASLGTLRELGSKAVELLSRPETAKDQVLLDVEAEKRDLMKALRERTEQLRAYTLERREVERSLGESLMELNRKLEARDSQEREWLGKAAALELRTQEFQGRLDLAEKASGQKDELFSVLAAERDELARALMAEAQRIQAQIQERAQTDAAWEAAVRSAQDAASAERDKRLAVEAQTADLRAQLQTLGDHIARLLQEKERVDGQQSGWKQERDGLLATLRKKEEMISMLSSTFQNLLKK